MGINSRYKLKTGEEVAYFPPIQNTASPYLTEAAMYADQANQLEGYGYLVDGVGAFTYLGTVAGTAADYEGFGANLRLSNLAGDLSTGEKDGIKTKLSITNGITGEGTTTKLAKFTASGNIGNSVITETAGGNIGVNIASPISKLSIHNNIDGVNSGIGISNAAGSDWRIFVADVAAGFSAIRIGSNIVGKYYWQGGFGNVAANTFKSPSLSAGATVVVIEAASGQTANMLEARNSAGIVLTKLDKNGNITSPKYNLSTLNTAPLSATDTGTIGEIRYTADYIYVCTSTNIWKRTALTTW